MLIDFFWTYIQCNLTRSDPNIILEVLEKCVAYQRTHDMSKNGLILRMPVSKTKSYIVVVYDS